MFLLSLSRLIDDGEGEVFKVVGGWSQIFYSLNLNSDQFCVF
jgi:hypothetical protein